VAQQQEEGPAPQAGAGPKNAAKIERFVRAFESTSVEISNLIEVLTHKEDGLIAAMDDLSGEIGSLAEEIRGLRLDMRAAAKARGLGSVFDLLRGG